MNDPLKRYRRRFRSWKNRLRLAREHERYRAAFRARRLAVPDDAAVRKAIAERFPGLRPKPKGTLKIVAIYHHYNWEDYALKPALEKFGTVRRYDWFGEFNHARRDWRRSVKAEMNRDLVVRIGQWVAEERPDVIFTYLSGEIIFPETVRALRAFGVPMIHFSLNDKEHFTGKVRGGLAFGSRDICRFFDLCWTSTEDALKKYCVEGAIPLYLSEGANPEIHRPLEEERTIDVSFVGQCYGNRPEIIRRLGEAGVRVEAFGYGWPAGPLSTEEMVRMYSKSRINLGFGGVDGHEDAFCLKGRDFEIPMSGGLYLTEYHPELETVYDLGKEIVAYRGFDDLLAKIRHLLAHQDEAEAIRRAGFRRARREHSWEMRFKRVFRLINIIE
ncbi:MAG: glycosyltransferase [Proteobacteria bacterium]|nr:glycosyltransferase [Pseudomonadota bacterium]